MRILKRLLVVVTFLVLIVGTLGVVQAQSAKSASWQVAVTYQNVGAGPALINVDFFAEGDDTPISFNPLEGVGAGTLAAGAGASFWIGSVSGLSDGWNGSAVMSSDQPLVATVVQFSSDSGFKMRLLSNGFQGTDASEQYLVATTLLNKYNRTTVFSIQNIQDAPIQATVIFYNADAGGAVASTITHTIPANSSKYIDMSLTADTGLPVSTTTFNGSAIVTAVLDSDGVTPADVVAAASEYYTNRPVAANFEGVPLSKAADTIYLSTGLCERYGLDTYYAVQNASLVDSAFIEVVYYNAADGTQKAVDGRFEIGPGGKKSIVTCSPSDATAMSNFSGSAVINSYDAATGDTPGAPIVAIGKAQTSQNAPTPTTADAFTAFLAEPQGVSKIALPFIRWASNSNFVASKPGKQRTYVAVQNLEDYEIKVNVSYNDRDGNQVTTEVLTIPAFSKGNSDPNGSGAVAAGVTWDMNVGEFGYYTDGGYGAGVILEAHPDNPTATFIAIVRANNVGASEDYNGLPIQ